MAVGWCAGVARLGERSTWEGAGAFWRLTGVDASVGAGSLISSAGGEVFSLLATVTSSMAAAAAKALASEVTAIPIVVVWVCLGVKLRGEVVQVTFLSFSAF